MQFAEHLDLGESQSPEGVGSVVVALAGDQEHSRFNGQVLTVAGLAERYGVDPR